MQPVFRPLNEPDIEKTIALFSAVLDELHSDNPPARGSYSNQYSADRLKTLLTDREAVLLVVTKDEEQIGFGFGRAYGGIGFLHWIGLRPDKRGNDIGQKMIDYFIHEFKKRDCHKAELYTYQERPKLKSLYEQVRFKEARKLDNWFHLNVFHMTKMI